MLFETEVDACSIRVTDNGKPTTDPHLNEQYAPNDKKAAGEDSVIPSCRKIISPVKRIVDAVVGVDGEGGVKRGEGQGELAGLVLWFSSVLWRGMDYGPCAMVAALRMRVEEQRTRK